jgi:hypothetical protein
VHVQRSVGLGISRPVLTVGIALLDARPRIHRAHVMMPDATCEVRVVSPSLSAAVQTRQGNMAGTDVVKRPCPSPQIGSRESRAGDRH